MASVACCMIVKNESRFIRQCLDSVVPWVDKVIVVDTGSTDDTVEIIKSTYPSVELRYFEWNGSFADARNESIRDCGTTFFFQLDADETIYPEHGPILKPEIDKLDALGMDGALVGLHNATSTTADPKDVFEGKARHGTPSQVPRVTRALPEAKYVGRIHEDTSDFLMSRGMKLGFVGFHILHWGANEEIVKGRDKIERNVKLLQDRILDEPDNITMYGYLALEMLNRYPDNEVYEICKLGWMTAEKRPEKGTLSRLGVVKATLEHRMGLYDEAFATLELFWTVDGCNSDSDFLAGLVWESVGQKPETPDYQKAECFLQAISHFEFALNPIPWESNNLYIGGSSGYLARARMGWCFYFLGKFPEAKICFDLALQDNKDCQPAKDGLQTLEAARLGGLV